MNFIRQVLSIAGVSTTVAVGLSLSTHAALSIDWSDLRPAGQPDMLTVDLAGDPGRETSATLENKTVEITGYMVPSDRDDDRVYEFLLVPWAGACSHMPAPAPNQVLRVHASTPFNGLGNYEIVTVTGTLTSGRDLTQLYILDGVTIVESSYQLSATNIVSRGLPVPEPAQHGQSPWKFLDR